MRILFVCAGNTCRSVMAERIARVDFPALLNASSAGISPQPIEDAEEIVKIIRGFLPAGDLPHRPRDVRYSHPTTFDLVVAMDSEVASEFEDLFPAFPQERLIRWNIPDPWGSDPATYRNCAQEIRKSLARLIAPAGGETT